MDNNKQYLDYLEDVPKHLGKRWFFFKEIR